MHDDLPAMDDDDLRRGRSIQRGTAHAEHLAGGVDKEGTQAFTA
ncbi:hypothetical protein [Klebsiella pneumoniae]